VNVHPAADLFPLLTGDEYQALVDDIREHGQREPITLHEGTILDGRNRWRACEELGIEPVTRQWDERGSATAFVVSANIHRRHLNPSERATIAADLLPLFETEAKERQREAGRSAAPGRPAEKEVAILPPLSKARDEAARLVGVSPRYVSDAKRVKEQAPDLAAEVRNGTKTLPQAKAETDARAVIKRYPEANLPMAKPHEIVTIGRNLDRLPEAEREQKRAALRRLDPHVTVELAEKPPMPTEAPPADPALGWSNAFMKLSRLLYSVDEEGGLEAIAANWSVDNIRAAQSDFRRWIVTLESWIRLLEEMETEDADVS
jgi:ParB-like chromosome segregation protein Spo0J